MPAVGDLLRALAPVLQRFGNRWYVFGAQAVVLWGRPRLTGDVDVTVFLDPVIAPEELVVTKILAGRPKDLEDVQGILQAQGVGFDLQRVRAILADLEEGLGQSDLLPALEARVAALSRSRR